ncbi:STPAP polymerase, partial [Heliornis fulica]|nr:STPAP polymerase [Heliornis fulica]
RLALLNTRFLRLCAEADERVRPLVYAVRLWAKQRGLAGSGAGGGSVLSNYALTLLVLFFLQTRSPAVLPPVARLRELAGTDCPAPRPSPRPARGAGPALLADFFRVFGDFDFAGQLISLREGRALPLLPPDTPEAGEGLKLGPFNLQDPFELDHNVAANVTEKTTSRFGRCCRDAAKYCRSLQFRRKSSKGRAWGLTRLFQPGAVEPGAGSAGAFLISLPLEEAAGGSQDLCGEPRDGGNKFGEACAAVTFVLRDVLKCSCVVGNLTRAPGEDSGL